MCSSDAYDFVGKGLEIRPLSVKVDTGFLVIRFSKSFQQALTEEFSHQFLAFYKNGWVDLPGL